ncbi:endonuclease MutS2 isoform X2 [Benincasa hispida]|uniref:endonuclease MutS2 isoform X2 n=1 Tax=Benincasa hispida TaxID=102211 RepID=UPI001901DC48|nr:endonuclease MutS2 isoform X2 [Benincasa hispida]
MEISYSFVAIRKAPCSFPRVLRPVFSLSSTHESVSVRIATSQALQNETLRVLEWSSICRQLSTFTSTSMGFDVAQKANVRFGRTREESQKLLDQTTAAEAVVSIQLDFSGIEDVSGILNSASSGKLLTIAELCSVRRTLKAARELFEKLQALAVGGHSSDRFMPLLAILQNCDFLVELERKIEFCIDCNYSIILDRASEDLELIRLEKKRNMEELDSLLKEVSFKIYQARGIDRPLITKRRSRMCVAVRATHKNLVSDGILLSASNSGATYFMEPKNAVDLNNMEVRLSNSEKAEEIAILGMLSTEISESEIHIRYLLDRILELDLALARAAYARWMSGVCPCFSAKGYEGLNSSITDNTLSVDIDAIQNPLLLSYSLTSSSDNALSYSANVGQFDKRDNVIVSEGFLGSVTDFPIPIDIKIKRQTRVVVISGPNTGGKTASIKTLGLASLMAKAGMYLPAKNQPKLPWFDLVLADIGDHQSLEQNLSTFSGHISRLCKILEVSSDESLVLIDEIGSGTDPSEGVALSTSILQYLKNCVNLAIVTTHYADLTRIKDSDSSFENAAVEFSLETLKPTYKILWGNTGNSNALTIAEAIGFDPAIIERAKKWMVNLTPETQDERKGLLFKSLIEERDKLEAQRQKAASLHAEISALYKEIQEEAKDLDKREQALMALETRRAQQETAAIKSKIETVVQEFEEQLKIAGTNQLSSLIKKAESAIASICEACSPTNDSRLNVANANSYTPQLGEQVFVTGLGNKLATVVEASDGEETILVQYGKIKVRVKKSSVKALPNSEKKAAASTLPYSKRQCRVDRVENPLVVQMEVKMEIPMVLLCRLRRIQSTYVVCE